jgi:3-oxoacyl-[acyl-carrier-protein] synthase II
MRRVVVTGMGLVTPLGIGLERNWNSLVDGVSGVRAIQSFDVSDLPVKIAAQVPRGETASGLFNADDWVPPKDQRKMDGFIVFALAAAAQAVEDAGWTPQAEEARERTGVIIGSGIGGLPGITDGALTIHERGPRRLSPFFIPANLINLASGHVSIRYGFTGPNHAVVTACSSGAHAIGDAARLITLDDASVSPALRRRARCLPGSTTTRRGHRVRGTGNATVSSWARAPESSSLKNTSTPGGGEQRSTPR